MGEFKVLRLPITMQLGDTQSTVYPTLLWDHRNLLLADCGFMGAISLLEAELQRYGASLEHLTRLVLTHHDHDHMGAAAALKRKNPKLVIYASAAEAPWIAGEKKPLRLCQAEELQKTLAPEQQVFGKAFCDMLRRVEPVQVDRLLQDGETLDCCGGCRAIATPGHTPGHISLLVQEASILITGDAMALEEGGPMIPNPQFTLDMEQAVQSMEALLAMKAHAYYCYHGGVYAPGA